MKKKQFRSLWLIAAVLALILTITALTGQIWAKYIDESFYNNGTLRIQANLAGSVQLLEHLAVRQIDGSYALVTQAYAEADPDDDYEEETFADKGNTYILMPGVDIPKDPQIIVEGKTKIPAYLYIEVVTSGDVGSNITYSLTDDWLKLDDVNGKKSEGTVYVYCGGGAQPVEVPTAASTDTKWTVDILAPLVDGKPETIQVSQKLIAEGKSAESVLEFYVTLAETSLTEDKSADAKERAKTVYNNL